MPNRKEIVLSLRFAILVFALAGLVFCGFWIPHSLKNLQESFPWLEACFYWICSLPCFVILGLGWDITTAFSHDLFFEIKSAKEIFAASLILMIDCPLFAIGNVVTYFLLPNGYEFFYFFLSVTGFCLGILFLAISRYVRKAIEVEKENEAIV
jgi:hypothetical protein